jgi:Gpi18-like mannosyltransferase
MNEMRTTHPVKLKLAEVKRLVVKYDILLAISIAVAVILASVWLGYMNSKVIPVVPGYRYSSHDPLNFLSDWDGPYYLHIAKYGYTNLLSAGFYPLYPLLVRVFYYVLRSYLLSALFVSWVSLVGAVYFYLKIVRQLGMVDSEANRFMSILPFVLFPTGVFLVATYTESLFAALALGSIYFSLKRHFIPAGIFLLLANLTHVTGILLITLDILILCEERTPIWKSAAVLLKGAVGAFAFMAFLYVRYHNALAFYESQTQVHEWLGKGYRHLLSSMSGLNALFVVLLVVSAVYFWRRRKSFSVYALLFLLIPILGTQWGGFDRYVLMAFPIPLMMYESLRRKPQAYYAVVVLSAMLWTYTLVQYTAGYIGS